MKKILVIPAVAALLLSGCGDDSTEYELAAAAVCTAPDGTRVDDSYCNPNSDAALNGFLWYYMAANLAQPAIGTQVVHNTYYSSPKSNPFAGTRRPANADVYRSVPKTGWKPTAGATGFSSSKKVNATAPKVKVTILNQKPAPNKPVYNPPKAPAPKPPAPKPPAPRR